MHGRELDQLCRFASVLGTTLDTATLVEDSLESFVAMAGADRVMIALAGQDARVLHTIAGRGWDIPVPARGIPAPFVAALGTEALAFESSDDLAEPLEGKLGKKKKRRKR